MKDYFKNGQSVKEAAFKEFNNKNETVIYNCLQNQTGKHSHHIALDNT